MGFIINRNDLMPVVEGGCEGSRGVERGLGGLRGSVMGRMRSRGS